MVDKRTLILGMSVLFALAGPVPQSESQTVFPVRFDAPEPRNPATAQSTGGMQIQSGTHYWKRVALEVTPNSDEDIIDITASQDDTTVWVQVLVAAVQADTTSPSSAREEFKWAIFDATAGTWSSLQEGLFLDVIGGGTIAIDFNLTGSQMNVSVKTPGNLDLITMRIEVVANKSVTFFEHF